MAFKCKCRGCTKRHPGCHSECPDYKEYRRQIDEANKARKLENEANSIFINNCVRAQQNMFKQKKKGHIRSGNWKGE